MSAETCLNLDRLCARYGWEIARQTRVALKKNAENHITKSLGVLQEDGVYAFFLYQASRGEREKKGAEALRAQAHALLQAAQISVFDRIADSLEAVRGSNASRGLADDVDSLFLAKCLLEQALIYARYHAKGLESESWDGKSIV